MNPVFDRGIWFSEGKKRLAVDPSSGKKKADLALISHAHSDHVSKGHLQYLMTLPTYELLKNQARASSKTETTEFGKVHSMGDTQIQLENAGHVLGSAQIVLENSTKTLVTGDFKTKDSLTLKGAEPISCDTLVCETTFGLPEYVFSDRESVYAQIGGFVEKQVNANHFVVLCGYALGKAQELTKIVNEYSNQIPLVHDRIFAHNQTYEEFGVKLGEYVKAEGNLREGNVLILPPTLLGKHMASAISFTTGKRVVTAMATGWKFNTGFDATFALSDHCDFKELMAFVEAVSPKQVLTMHGFEKEFAHAVRRKLGIPARPLGNATQQTLSEFAFA